MVYLKNIFLKTRYFTLYGLLMAALVFMLKWLQWRFLVLENSMDIYAGLIAVSFTILGIWIARQMAKPKIETVIVEKAVYPTADRPINETELKKLNLSEREYSVLQLICKGHSNAEIAECLFLSLSTIKTHVSNLFVKMDVKSRAQAIEKAQRLRIK